MAEHKCYHTVVWLGQIKAANLLEGRVRLKCVRVYKVGTVVPKAVHGVPSLWSNINIWLAVLGELE